MGSPVRIDVHDSPAYSWTMARRAAHPGLAAIVAGYCGYVEQSVLPMRRREVATAGVTLIVSFGDPIAVQLSTERSANEVTSFVAGLHDGWVVTEHGGRQQGMQIDLTPLGAHRLLGVPPADLANSVVPLDQLGRDPLSGMPDRLASAPDWASRFEILDDELLRWSADGPDADAAVAWAWRQLAGSHGGVSVGMLADEIGWSRRHFAARFRQHVGLAPKPVAKVLRFQRAVGVMRAGAGAGRTLADVAAACGYADHSHLVRDFHDLAGCTPSALLGAELPDGGGVAA